MLFHKLCPILLVPLLISPHAAVADEARQSESKRLSPGQFLLQADSDGDGKVSLTEVRAKRPDFPEARFSNLDKNGDGLIEPAEIGPPQGASGAAMMARLRAADSDGDMRVSKAEFDAQFPNVDASRFSTLDRNNDGYIDRQDRAAAPATAARPARPSANAPRSAGSDVDTYVMKIVQNHDTDQDGRVTLAELTQEKHGFPASVFGRLDRNNDGALSAEDAGAAARPQKKADKAPKAAERQAGKPKAGKEKNKAKMDANGDGKITFEEAKGVNPNYTRERFDARDRNGDGVLSKEDRAGQ